MNGGNSELNPYLGSLVPFGFKEEQRNPDLAQFADAEAEPPAKRVKKIS